MAIQIQFLANVVQFLKGTKSVEEALDDVADSLDDVVKDADHAGEKMGDSLTDGAKEGEKAADRLDRTFRELADSAKRAGDDAGDGLSSGVRKGTREAGEGLDEFKSESNSTARESAASFTGEWTDVGDVIQEIAANAFAGFGPLGAAAGLVAAAGIGIAISAIEQGIESSEEYRAKVEELGDEWISTGKLGQSSIDFLIEQLQKMATTTEDGAVSLKQLKKLSEDSNTSFRNLAGAYGENEEHLRQMWRDTDALQQKQTEAVEEAFRNGSTDLGMLEARAEATGKVTDYIGQQIGIAAEAAEAQRLYAAAGGPELEAKAALISTVNDAYDATASNVEDFINEESGLFDVSLYIDSMKKRSDALANYQSDLAAAKELTPEAKAFLNAQGADAAATFLGGYKAASPAQKQELNRIWSEAGKENSGEYAGALNKGLPDKLDKKPKVEAEADTSSAERDLNKLANKVRYATIVAKVVDRNGQPVP